MPVQIGSSTHSFADPTGLLSDCHRRVEMFIGALKSVADRCDQLLSEDSRRSLDLALRYFREAAPKHTADEEESLFPRLRKINSAELQTSLEKLDALEGDHRWAEPLHQLVENLGSRLLREGKLIGIDADQFRLATGSLKSMYERHIEVEEKQVFPLAAKVLSPELKAEIAKEMESRRGLGLVRTIE